MSLYFKCDSCGELYPKIKRVKFESKFYADDGKALDKTCFFGYNDLCLKCSEEMSQVIKRKINYE